MYTPEEGGGAASTDADPSDATTQRWTSVFHSTNGWMHAPPGSYFQRSGETIELVLAFGTLAQREGLERHAVMIR